MTIHIYNTLSKKKEEFVTVEPNRVRMYVCGPTVYDSSHIGHGRSAVVFDVIVRHLRFRGFKVTYVRNFTDVDDKIINRARELNTHWKELADKYIQEFYSDMDALNVQRADIEPKATEHIKQMISVIENLIRKGHAYQINGDVFFSVESFRDYGKLSGRRLQDMEAGARVEVDERKRNPFDFALWKASKPQEPAWDSPWGKGRPGWHIECSAMSVEYLGATIDIHGGGKDLIFPHHENEIAQSEAAFGTAFVKYWVHNGFVNINQEKMSKSLGNFLLIKDLLKRYHPEAVRLFLLSKHYRSPIDFSEKAIQEASSGLEKIYSLLDRIGKTIGRRTRTDVEIKEGRHLKGFCEAMDDDFNSAQALGILFEAVKDANRLLDKNENNMTPEVEREIRTVREEILKMGDILGILSEPPSDFFQNKKRKVLEEQSVEPAIIDRMVQERDAARKAKDWAAADRIRQQLAEMNVILEDRPDGTIWKVKS
ncbi:MAG: cysteine--tRNA ligase [Deltaproteobacteria bacterium]|nr:cysteine--tRNA ligase [Deltaproteobacteria bacterium]